MTDANRKWAAGLRALILKKLNERGPMTTHDLANACQVNQDAVAPRMTELEAEGSVRDTGHRQRSVSGKGRPLKVWEATSQGADQIGGAP
jgi:predicted ArsR family transcriptional regulator